MGLKTQIKTLDLLKKIVGGNINTLSYIEFKPEKPDVTNQKKRVQFERATPESQGINTNDILSFLKELTENEKIHPHSIMIVRNGFVITEGSFMPFDKDVWQLTHSMCKSLTGIAVGMAIEEGYFSLEDSITKIFNRSVLPIIGKRRKEITVEHLLKMSSGITFNEVGSLIEQDWVSCFLNSPVAFEPGTKFAYNSMNTYMLSALIHQTTGHGLLDFLKDRLLEPLGIQTIYWETCPMGIEKGGWGLFIDLEDRTKIAQVLLNKGKWGNRQLVSEKWIEKMTMKQIETPESMNQYGYGYQVWMGKRKGSFQFNGVLGQNTIIYPDLNMIISITSGNAELFVNSPLMDVVEKHFCREDISWDGEKAENKAAQEKLKQYLGQMYVDKQFAPKQITKRSVSGWKKMKYSRKEHFSAKINDLPAGMESLYGQTFQVEETDASILPLFIQGMQNNFSQGINEISFSIEKSHLYVTVVEGDMEFHLPVGFSHPIKSEISVHGDKYLVKTWGKLTSNEDEIPVLKIMFAFIEFTNYRVMKIFLEKQQLRVKMIEEPNLPKVLDQAMQVLDFSLSANSIDTIKNLDIAQYKMSQMTEPEWIAVKKSN